MWPFFTSVFRRGIDNRQGAVNSRDEATCLDAPTPVAVPFVIVTGTPDGEADVLLSRAESIVLSQA